MYRCLRRTWHPKQQLLIHFNFLLFQLSQYSETQALSKMPWDTDVTESQEFRIISRLTQPDPSISTAIHQLLDLTSVAAASTTVSTSEALLLHFDNTWQALIEIVVANTAPAQQAVLVKFVQTLQQQKVLDPATGDQLRFDQDYNMRVWTDSPNFGINLADHWNFSMLFHLPISISPHFPIAYSNHSYHTQTLWTRHQIRKRRLDTLIRLLFSLN
jgi:hypothetical protein